MIKNSLEKSFCDKERTKTKAAKERKAKYQQELPERNPARYKAKCLVAAGIKNGILVKRPCEECGEVDVEAHHQEYSKPLAVVWLCRKHHMAVHGKKLNDYSDIPEERKEELKKIAAMSGGVGRGGKRENAGRPVVPGYVKKVPVLITMDQSLIDWMKTQPGTRAGIIEKSLLMLKKSLEPC